MTVVVREDSVLRIGSDFAYPFNAIIEHTADVSRCSTFARVREYFELRHVLKLKCWHQFRKFWLHQNGLRLSGFLNNCISALCRLIIYSAWSGYLEILFKRTLRLYHDLSQICFSDVTKNWDQAFFYVILCMWMFSCHLFSPTEILEQFRTNNCGYNISKTKVLLMSAAHASHCSSFNNRYCGVAWFLSALDTPAGNIDTKVFLSRILSGSVWGSGNPENWFYTD